METQGQVSPAPIPTRAISRTISVKKGCLKCPVSLDMGQGIRMPSLSRRRLPGARRKKRKKISDKYCEPPWSIRTALFISSILLWLLLYSGDSLYPGLSNPPGFPGIPMDFGSPHQKIPMVWRPAIQKYRRTPAWIGNRACFQDRWYNLHSVRWTGSYLLRIHPFPSAALQVSGKIVPHTYLITPFI